MGSRFVRPDTTVLKISRGDTLTVKRRLTSGEQRAAYARMYIAGVDGEMRVNPLQVGLARITAYLLDWSFTDTDGRTAWIRGQPIEAVISALDALDMESFVEIREAIDAHEQAMLAEREQEKNAQGDENRSPAISPSPGAAAGGTSGLPN